MPRRCAPSTRGLPSLPPSFFKFPIRSRLNVIQQYIISFEYKQSPQTSFNSHKSRPLARIMDTAKMMIYNPQPIKCVEAVFLALYLTAGIPDAERIPLGFKSELHGQVHQHIVLLVKYNNKFGAFGISRQHNLMSKEFQFESISSIVDDFRRAYEEYEHKVLRIRVGLPVEHNIESFNFVCWRYLSLDPSLASWEQCSKALERHMIHGKRLWERWLLDGQRENKRAELLLRNPDTQPILEWQESSFRRKNPKCSSEGIPTVKAMKRRRVSNKQEPDFKLGKARKPCPPQEGQIVRPVSATRRITLNCHSIELFSGSCRQGVGLQTESKSAQMKHDTKSGRECQKLELPTFSTKPVRKLSRKKTEGTQPEVLPERKKDAKRARP